jgi:hypothetical protein
VMAAMPTRRRRRRGRRGRGGASAAGLGRRRGRGGPQAGVEAPAAPPVDEGNVVAATTGCLRHAAPAAAA